MAELPDGYTVNFESIPAGMGGPELFTGLPDDACQSPQWSSKRASARWRASFTTLIEERVWAAGEWRKRQAGLVSEPRPRPSKPLGCGVVHLDPVEATAPHSEEGGYINFIADDDQERANSTWRCVGARTASPALAPLTTPP
jgi:hypothetical protein